MHLLRTPPVDANSQLSATAAPESDFQSPAKYRHLPRYRADIDGLRALAIIPVILFHAFPSLMPGGFVGVDIFFVISGFLISNILLEGLEKGTFSFAAFYRNRIRRLFPALLVLLAACLAAGWFLLLPDEYENLGKHMVGAVGYVENFVLRREAGYFDVRSQFKPLMHLWSLGIEEQFYLTYPLFLWAMWRVRRMLFPALVLVAAGSFALNIVYVRGDAAGAFFLPQTRCWELAAGCAIACWQILRKETYLSTNLLRSSMRSRWPRVSDGPIGNVFSAAGVALIAIAVLRIREHDAFPGWYALLPVCGAALLIVAGPKAHINRLVLSDRRMVFVGLISYPLYLWHWPILTFPRMLAGGEIPVSWRIAGIVLSFALAWLTFHFVEKPIRFGRKNWFRPVALAAVSVVLACVGYAATRDGYVRRFPGVAQDLGDLRKVVWSTSECRTISGLSKIDYCRTTSVKPPDVLLIGDSHAAVLYEGLAPLYRQRSLTLMNLGEAGCAPFYDTETVPGERDRDCSAPVNGMLDFAAHSASVRTIIFSARGPRYMSGEGFGAVESGAAPKKIRWKGAPAGAPQPEMYAGALRYTIARLSSSGKTVILFIDWPELGFDSRSCLARPFGLFPSTRKFCEVPRKEVDLRNRAYRGLMFRLASELGNVKLFDPLPWLCDSSACYALKDGRLLYSDSNHVSIAGAEYLATKYFDGMN